MDIARNTALLLLAGCAASAAAATPSFLFMLADDIGWGDFHYNNGTALTPNIDAWVKRDGTVLMQDFHSGGTVCSPTRATVLTGRNHFRDCVNYVYGCSDMTECVPSFEFNADVFTVADAARAAGIGYESMFSGKWHLGSFYNDSERYGGRTSSPLSHGFDRMNATVEVSPTATTNCGCNAEWEKHCDFGHYKKHNHCAGGPSPAGSPDIPKGCCFNYWWEDPTAAHGVTNLTWPSPDDDSSYLADSFERFVATRDDAGHAPFLAQISFHNCHIPFIGTNASREACANGTTCRPPEAGAAPYGDAELDYYACLNELDRSVGRVLGALDAHGYRDDTLIWFTTDNGPEVNCGPEGFCGGTERRPSQAPGSAGPLRGRKRDIYEGGHRVPGVIAWPAVVRGPARVSWDTVVTMDFLPTVMEVLNVSRPAAQREWALDGVSALPILQDAAYVPPARGIGWWYNSAQKTVSSGWGYRYGKWKYVVGSTSCKQDDCKQPQLYDLATDLGERHNLAAQEPAVLAAIEKNFSAWYDSVQASRQDEAHCGAKPPTPAPAPTPPTPAPPTPAPRTDCAWSQDTGLEGADADLHYAASKEACCALCWSDAKCAAADFNAMKCGGAKGVKGDKCCHIKHDTPSPVARKDGSVSCTPARS